MARSGSDRGEERARDERVWIRGFPHDTRCLACPSFTFTSATPSKIKEHLASRHHSRAVTRANTPWFADEFADTETAAPAAAGAVPAAAQVAAQVVANDGAFDMPVEEGGFHLDPDDDVDARFAGEEDPDSDEEQLRRLDGNDDSADAAPADLLVPTGTGVARNLVQKLEDAQVVDSKWYRKSASFGTLGLYSPFASRSQFAFAVYLHSGPPVSRNELTRTIELATGLGAPHLSEGVERVRRFGRAAHILPVHTVKLTADKPLHFVKPSLLMRFVHCHPRLSKLAVCLPQVGSSQVTMPWQTPSWRELCRAVMVPTSRGHLFVGDNVAVPGLADVAVVTELYTDLANNVIARLEQPNGGEAEVDCRYIERIEPGANPMRAKASGREVVVAPFTLWMDDTGLARKKYEPGLTAFISHSGLPFGATKPFMTAVFNGGTNYGNDVMAALFPDLKRFVTEGVVAWDAKRNAEVLLLGRFYAVVGDTPMLHTLACLHTHVVFFWCRFCMSYKPSKKRNVRASLADFDACEIHAKRDNAEMEAARNRMAAASLPKDKLAVRRETGVGASEPVLGLLPNFDLSRMLAIDLLHVFELGLVKYLCAHYFGPLRHKRDQGAAFAIREALQRIDWSGFRSKLAADDVIAHYGSWTATKFRIWWQIAPFVLSSANAPSSTVRVWTALARLGAALRANIVTEETVNHRMQAFSDLVALLRELTNPMAILGRVKVHHLAHFAMDGRVSYYLAQSSDTEVYEGMNKHTKKDATHSNYTDVALSIMLSSCAKIGVEFASSGATRTPENVPVELGIKLMRKEKKPNGPRITAGDFIATTDGTYLYVVSRDKRKAVCRRLEQMDGQLHLGCPVFEMQQDTGIEQVENTDLKEATLVNFQPWGSLYVFNAYKIV